MALIYFVKEPTKKQKEKNFKILSYVTWSVDRGRPMRQCAAVRTHSG